MHHAGTAANIYWQAEQKRISIAQILPPRTECHHHQPLPQMGNRSKARILKAISIPADVKTPGISDA
jgi:hypothetical protein